MEQPEVPLDEWSNPAPSNLGNACPVDPETGTDLEAYEQSTTIDPSHIIHLIRQLLTHTGQEGGSKDKQEHGQKNGFKITEGTNPHEWRQGKQPRPAEGQDAATQVQHVHEEDKGTSSATVSRGPVQADGSQEHDDRHVQPLNGGIVSKKREREAQERGGEGSAKVDEVELPRAISSEDGIAGSTGSDEPSCKEAAEAQPAVGTEEEAGEDTDSWEDAGCVLWDLAASEAHAEFMVGHHLLDVLLTILRGHHSNRAREICLGILGNLACHALGEQAMVKHEGLVRTVVQQLYVDDPPSLTEACRLLSAGLHSDEAAAWVAALNSEDVLSRILWMTTNTLQPQLLEKSTMLMLAMVDSHRDAANVLAPQLLRLGLLNMLTDLLSSELEQFTDPSRNLPFYGDAVIDTLLQIAEALSMVECSADHLASNAQIFALACQVIRLSNRDEIGPSAVSATVLLANLLADNDSLISEVSRDAVLLEQLMAILPGVGDDPGARNALWSILSRVGNALLASEPYGLSTNTAIVAVLVNSSDVVMEDLREHQADDADEDERHQPGARSPDSEYSASRGLQGKLSTVNNMARVMERCAAIKGWNCQQELPRIQSTSAKLRKFLSSQGYGHQGGPNHMSGSSRESFGYVNGMS